MLDGFLNGYSHDNDFENQFAIAYLNLYTGGIMISPEETGTDALDKNTVIARAGIEQHKHNRHVVFRRLGLLSLGSGLEVVDQDALLDFINGLKEKYSDFDA